MFNYYKNKPLYNSIISGVIYFLFSWSVDFMEITKAPFMVLMFFLPGLTFPLLTCYLKRDYTNYSNIQFIIHLILSILIYYGSVYLFIEISSVFGGIMGSLFFQLETKILLKKAITWKQIITTCLLSGIGFIPYQFINHYGVSIGIGILLWTILNGHLLNNAYKKTEPIVI